MTAQRVVDDLQEIIDLLALEGFTTLELSGRRRDAEAPPASDEEFRAPRAEQTKPADDEPSGDWALHSFIRNETGTLSVRLRATTDSADLVDVVVDLAVTYTKAEPFEPSDEVLELFLRDVAVMQLFPYVRQAMSDLTGRLGAPLTMPMITRANVHAMSD